MNKVQTNQFRMFTNTRETLDANTLLWNGIPIMVSTKNQFDELVQRTLQINEKTNANSKAVTEDKDKKLLSVAEKILALAGTLYAFGSFTNNAKLMGLALNAFLISFCRRRLTCAPCLILR